MTLGAARAASTLGEDSFARDDSVWSPVNLPDKRSANIPERCSAQTVGAQGSSGTAAPGPLVVKHLGLMPYAETFAAMRAFTATRNADSADQIWLTEHAPVYTLGLAARREHVLDTHGIALVQTDRGGQVTYHGPGQLIAYLLIDLRRRNLKVLELVRAIEAAVIATLAELGIAGHRRDNMPGVYVDDAKIAALGLKVKGGCSYHGVSLNVDGALAPFAGIHPCGYQGLPVTSLSELGARASLAQTADRLALHLQARIGGQAVPSPGTILAPHPRG